MGTLYKSLIQLVHIFIFFLIHFQSTVPTECRILVSIKPGTLEKKIFWLTQNQNIFIILQF